MTTYQELIKETALADERYVVMTAENRAVVRELPPLLGNRFIDTGITEQTMIGMAAGLALRGRIPVCHALAPFLIYRAYEFVRTDVGIAHHASSHRGRSTYAHYTGNDRILPIR